MSDTPNMDAQAIIEDLDLGDVASPEDAAEALAAVHAELVELRQRVGAADEVQERLERAQTKRAESADREARWRQEAVRREQEAVALRQERDGLLAELAEVREDLWQERNEGNLMADQVAAAKAAASECTQALARAQDQLDAATAMLDLVRQQRDDALAALGDM